MFSKENFWSKIHDFFLRIWTFFLNYNLPDFFLIIINFELFNSVSWLKKREREENCLSTRGVIRCQFHQHFISSFFIQKCFFPSFYVLTVWVLIFWWKEIGAKVDCKMLVKLTTRSTNVRGTNWKIWFENIFFKRSPVVTSSLFREIYLNNFWQPCN